MDCPSCAVPCAADARFCMSCGRPLVATDAEAVQARRTVTVVFGDLAGSTELGERLDPEALREVMLRYYAVMRECLEHHGGTVEKFIGDAVMAVFGVPQVHEDDVVRGVRAAWDMQCAMEALNEDLAAGLGVRLRLRVGVNTGEVLYSREFGDGHALVSGDTVNVAARLQQHAPDGGILLGSTTRRAVNGAAVVEPVEPLLVKGKARALSAWRLLGVDPGGRERELGEMSPLVGREAELRELRAAWDRSVAQRGCHLFTLLGEPGMGKSRLASEFLEEVRGRGAAAALTRCQPYDGGGALQALAELLRGLLGESADGAGPSEALDLLASREDGPAAAALLRGVLDGVPDGAVVAVEDTFWAMGVLLEALGATRPVVLLFDDLQWGQATLFDLIDHLTDWTMGVPVLLLCLARLDLLDVRPRWSSGTLSATSRVLGPLSPGECARLVASCAEVSLHGGPDEASGDGAVDTLQRIADTAEGNPLFAEQLVAALTDGGPADELPPTIQVLLEARLDRLPREEHQVLEHASVIGREFTGPGLEALARPVGSPTPDGPGPAAAAAAPVAPVLHSLVRRRLIEPVGRRPGGSPTFRFVHLLARDVCYAGLPKRRRAALHQSYADWLAAQDGTASGDHVIGRHLAEAYRNLTNLAARDRALPELGARAAQHLLAAGRAALLRGECSWAVELLDQCVGLPAGDRSGRLSARLRLAEALIATGERERARELLGELVGSGGGADPVLAAHARLQLAGLTEPGDALAAVVRAARAALPVFSRARDDLGLARARLAVAHESQSRCRYTSASMQFTAALTAADRSGAALEQATALGGLAVTLWLGPEPADTAVDRCRALLAGPGARRRAGRAAVCCPLAVLLAMRRADPAEARALLAEADRIVRELGVAGPRAAIETFGGLVEVLAGEPDAAEQRLRRACELSRSIGDPDAHATALSALARLLLDAGREQEAVVLVDGARDEAGLGSPLSRAEREAVRARLLVLTGRHGAALERSAYAVRLASAGDSPAGLALVLLDRARVLLAVGRADGKGGDAGSDAGAVVAEAGRLFAAKGHLPGVRWAQALEQESGVRPR